VDPKKIPAWAGISHRDKERFLWKACSSCKSNVAIWWNSHEIL